MNNYRCNWKKGFRSAPSRTCNANCRWRWHGAIILTLDWSKQQRGSILILIPYCCCFYWWTGQVTVLLHAPVCSTPFAAFLCSYASVQNFYFYYAADYPPDTDSLAIISKPAAIAADWLTDWMTDWGTEGLTNWQSDRQLDLSVQ